MLDVSEKADERWRVMHIDRWREPVNSNYVEQWRKMFICFDAMPTKTKEAVSWLAMCKPMGRIEGIGQKVSSKTYWLQDNDLLEDYNENKKEGS